MPGVIRRSEERVSKRGRHQFCTSLAAAVWVKTSHSVVLSVAPIQLAILVALVTRHHDDRANGGNLADLVKQMSCSHHIRRVRTDRILIRLAHDGLCSQVKHHLRRCGTDRSLQRIAISHVTDRGAHPLRDAAKLEEGWLGVGRECVPMYLRTESLQPKAEPTSLESSMPGEEDATSGPELVHDHFFQGALPVSQSSSSISLSRRVSIGCQKPSCWKA